EFGGSLMPPKNERNDYTSRYMNQGYRGHNLYGSLNLTRGDRSATTIKSLKGRMCVVLLAGTAPEVTGVDPITVKKKSFIGRTVEMNLESVDEDANQKGMYSVNVTVKKLVQDDPDRGIDYNWANNIWQKLELSDDKGNKYFCYGPNTFNNNGGSVQLVVQFGPDD